MQYRTHSFVVTRSKKKTERTRLFSIEILNLPISKYASFSSKSPASSQADYKQSYHKFQNPNKLPIEQVVLKLDNEKIPALVRKKTYVVSALNWKI